MGVRPLPGAQGLKGVDRARPPRGSCPRGVIWDDSTSSPSATLCPAHRPSRHCAMRAQRAYEKITCLHWILDLKRCQQGGSWILCALRGLELGSWACPAGWILDLGRGAQESCPGQTPSSTHGPAHNAVGVRAAASAPTTSVSHHTRTHPVMGPRCGVRANTNGPSTVSFICIFAHIGTNLRG